MKRKLLCIFGIAALIALLAAGSYANFTARGTAENVITAGDVKLELIEKTADGTDFPSEGVEILPGQTVSKIVTVKNVGGNPFYLRVKLTKRVEDAQLSAVDCLHMDINETDWEYRDGFYYYKSALAPDAVTTPLFSEVQIDVNNVDNRYLGKNLMLDVAVYAVQSANNGATVWDAVGWPAG